MRERLEPLAAKAIAAVGSMRLPHLRLLLMAGLLVRLAAAPAYGTQDMEWWKAWATAAVRYDLTTLYGAADADIVKAYREGKTFDEIVAATQRPIPYQPRNYWRTDFPVMQPPVYVYSLSVAGHLYQLVSPDVANGRMFNLMINLQPIAASAALAWLIAWLVGTTVSPAAGRLSGLVYWLNPLVILNAPIQGYQDPLCVFFATASIAALGQRHLTWSMILLTLGALTKPQGILIAPIVIGVGFMEHGWLARWRALGAAIVTGLVVGLPFLLAGRLLSVIVGVLAIGQASTDLTRQAMTLWWPVQYLYQAHTAVGTHGASVVTALAGGTACWACDVPVERANLAFGFPVQWIGLALLGVFTAANLWFLREHLPRNRDAVLTAAALQVYGYFVLRVGVQVNHYFLLIPLLALSLRPTSRHLLVYAWVCAIFLAQDLLFYGLGRDYNLGVHYLTRLSAGWLTVVLAAANILTFATLSARQFRHGSLVRPA